jgi:hypothetical protein
MIASILISGLVQRNGEEISGASAVREFDRRKE